MRAPRARRAAALVAALALATGCVSVELGGEPAPHVQLSLRDAGAAQVARRDAPLVDALLIQPAAGQANGETVAIAYARQEHEYAYYQYASWTERPARQLPRLLQRRLEARGVAGAVGLLGQPMQARWLLAVGIETLHHDVQTPPGQARLALTADLFDRQQRVRVARRHFDTAAPVASAESSAAAQAMSVATGRAFDELVPWLEGELQRASDRR